MQSKTFTFIGDSIGQVKGEGRLKMRNLASLERQEKIAGSFKPVGFLFWINASWALCGETSQVHLKALEGLALPSPIEIMVFLNLGWLFVLPGEYKAMRLKKSWLGGHRKEYKDEK